MAFNGRDLTISVTGVTIVTTRSKGASFSASPVDVTSDDSNGYRTLLADPGVLGGEYSFAGVFSNEVLLAQMMAAPTGRTLKNATLTVPYTGATPGTISSDIFFSEFTVRGEHDGETEVEGTLMTSGAITYTASTG